ncbi:MAG: aldo/keto reductase [Clostridia bacterium]|nr:aldo/keto reductase [Clostridia bacterium]
MKRIASLLFALTLVLLLAACAGTPNAPAAPPESAGGVKTNAFDLEKGTVLLNSGYEMPVVGIGTFMLTEEQAENSVYWALKAGTRLIDTAAAYNNEAGVGRGIQRAIDEGICTREEIFVTTKLWPSNYNERGVDRALETLGLNYIDLMLLHQPAGDYMGGYAALEKAVSDGKLRSIGLSNFSDEQFAEVAASATILPAVHQVETHIFNQHTAMRGFLNQYGTVLEAWFPLGGRGHTQEHLGNETITAIAEAHGVSAAQIIIRWHIQDGHIAIPGSSNEAHIIEDHNVFSFELTDEEMQAIRALNTDTAYYPGMGATSEETQAQFEQWANEWGLNID